MAHLYRYRCFFARRRGGLFHCTRASTALEFALLAPILFLLMMGIIEFSLIMFTMTVMEASTSNAARYGKTGYVAQNGTTRQQQIVAQVVKNTSGLLKASLITVTTKVYSNFDKVGQPEPCKNPVTPPCSGTPGVNFTDINGNGVWDTDMGIVGLGNAGDVVVYTVSYPWPIMTPIMRPFLGTTYTISARSVVRNEPY